MAKQAYKLWRGVKADERTIAMVEEAERLLGYDLEITQGGFNAGKVEQSAGTHDGAAIDVRAINMSQSRRNAIVTMLRTVGFAAWHRRPEQASKALPWPHHIHAVPIGGNISAGAQKQVSDYRAGKNGLKGGGKDDGPRVPIRTWEQYIIDKSKDGNVALTEKDQSFIRKTLGVDVENPQAANAPRSFWSYYTLKNFLTGKATPLLTVLWSTWYYSYHGYIEARRARVAIEEYLKLRSPAMTVASEAVTPQYIKEPDADTIQEVGTDEQVGS